MTPARPCECCGHPGGVCRACGRAHHPALADGCEGCAPPARQAKLVTCGCCSQGCVCPNHQDVPRGLRVRVCAHHRTLLASGVVAFLPPHEVAALLEAPLAAKPAHELQAIIQKVEAHRAERHRPPQGGAL